MPLGFSSGRPLTPLRVATSAFSPAITCRRASFSASSRSARASSSPRGRPERLICFEADMAGTGRVRAGPAQPRQLTSARPFAPRTQDPTKPLPYIENENRVDEDRAGDKGEVSKLDPGHSGSLTVPLKPGKYLLICNVPGHYEAGTWAEFTVTK